MDEEIQNKEPVCNYCQGGVNINTGVCRYCFQIHKEVADEAIKRDMDRPTFVKVSDDDDENLGELKV